MTAIFEDITLTWKGTEYVIRAGNVLRTIAKVEEIITVQELIRYAERDTAPLGKLSQAFAGALRLAGAKVSDDEVYSGMFKNAGDNAAISLAINTLLGMMIPRDFNPHPASSTVGKSTPAAASSSKNASKQRSAKAGLLPISSGH